MVGGNKGGVGGEVAERRHNYILGQTFSFLAFLKYVFLLLLVTVPSKVDYDLVEVETILISKECRWSCTAVILGPLVGSV